MPQTPAGSGDSQPSQTEPVASRQDPSKSDGATQEPGPVVKVRVNLVQVRVVVRDAHDQTVKGLKLEDFLLYDQGKLQRISSFAMESADRQREGAASSRANNEQKGTNAAGDNGAPKLDLPGRFVALVYDDVHMTLADVATIHGAAEKFLQTLAPADRVGIFSTSGQLQQDFTGDTAKLKKALAAILPKTATNAGLAECPNVTYYMADLIQNKNDGQALQIAVKDAQECLHSADGKRVESAVRTMVRRKLIAGDTENEMTYRHLEDIVRQLAGRPGERVMVLLSPGFLTGSQSGNLTGFIDRANEANIVVNTLDARGLFTPETGADLSRPTGSSIQTMGYDTSYRLAALSQSTAVLRDFAAGTGGTYFGNSNDLSGGMKLLAEAPETFYVLGFSPQDPKPDGRFRALRVTLAKDTNHYSIQARNGYYAEKTVKSPEQRANQEVEEASLSQQEIADMPLRLTLQASKSAEGSTLAVVSNIGMSGVRFRTVDGKKVNDLTIATVIFDENGKYVAGEKKTAEVKLSPENYESLLRFGLPMSSQFAVKPGRYLVRQVVREAEGEQMAAANGAIEVP